MPVRFIKRVSNKRIIMWTNIRAEWKECGLRRFWIWLGQMFDAIFRVLAELPSAKSPEPVAYLTLVVAFLALVVGVPAAVLSTCQIKEAAGEVEKSAQKMLNDSRNNLYNSDDQVDRMQLELAKGRTWSIFWRPNTSDPRDYWNQHVAFLLAGTGVPVTAVQTPRQLYELFTSPATLGDSLSLPVNFEEMRKTYILLSKTLDEIYSAYDNFCLKVIDETEMETWIGYLRSMGPHPMFLATLYHWQQSHYMTQDFAKFLQDRLLNDCTFIAGQLTRKPFYVNDLKLTSREVIEQVYPEFATKEFWEELPEKSEETLKREAAAK